MTRATIPVIGLVLAGLLSGCAPFEAVRNLIFGEEDGGRLGPIDSGMRQEDLVPYQVALTGVAGELEDEIRENARLFTLQDRPPGSIVALQRRAETDREVVQRVLRAHGYYAGDVEIAVIEEATPVTVIVEVDPGPVFTLTEFRVESVRPDYDELPILIPLADLGIELGQPARAREILAAEAELLVEMASRSYPLARVADRDVVVDHATNTVTVAILLDTGPFAYFGEADIRGLTDVERDYVRSLLRWQPGEPFDIEQLEAARRRLVETGLFSSIRLTPAQILGPEGRLPVIVELQERPHRSIGGGLSYSTVEGIGVEAFWEHRNLLNEGERLRLTAFYDFLGYGFDGSFRNPGLFGLDRDLVADAAIEREDTDAYVTTSFRTSAGIEFRLSPIWRLSTALGIERLKEERNAVTRDFTLASLPVRLRRDTTDELLDPTEGGRLDLQLQPYYGLGGQDVAFTRLRVGDAIYQRIFDEPRVVLAGWADLGTTLAAGLEEVPADKRFYAGGGGSIRGFGYQMAGPLDAEGDPIGGLSLLAFGGEARISVTESIGVVPFVEAGTYYLERRPDFDTPLRWGAGIGLRYLTPLGPIRADLAFPINRRPEDDAFQIYISLGQAF